MSTPSTEPASPALPAPVLPITATRLTLTWLAIRPWIIGAAILALAIAIGIALHDLLHQVSFTAVLEAMHATAPHYIVWALVATAASYLALTGYDSSALAYAGAKVSRGTVLLTSYVAYALGNTVGLGVLTGGAVRMRFYSAAGIEPTQIAQAIAFNAAAFGLGMTAFGALGLLWGADQVAPVTHLHAWVLQVVALLMLGALATFFVLCGRQRSLSIFGRWELPLPPLRLALHQLVISALELSASAAALWVLLPPGAVGLPAFVAFYAIAVAVSIISHVPGGLGVFEAVILLACGSHVPREAVLGALLLYRGIYFILPLVLATGLLTAYELRVGVAAPVGRAAVHMAPKLMAALALVAGLWLLFSGVTPASDEAAELLAMHVPLPLLEASHFIGSVAGLGLLLVARGLLHQLDAAWWTALALSIVAAILSLPKGIALNEAALLTSLALLLVISRKQFNRKSSLFAQRLEIEWLLAVAGVVGAAIFVLFFAYQQVHYANRLWWEFEFDAQAPRSLRALMAVALIGLAVSLWHLLRPPAGEPTLPSAEDLDKASAIVRGDPSADACVTLTGDKHFLFSPSGKSFIAYGKQGRSWVSLGGPVGYRKEWPELIWQFMELASDHGGRPVFYQVRPETLPMYLDCGLRTFKLGEHAHVPLPEFSLKGAKRADLRSGVNRAERDGMTFEVVPPERVHTVLEQMRKVSDAWLSSNKTREKSFSVGTFDPAYLQRMPVALVWRGDKLLAFANLLVTDRREEASVDLMRRLPDSPPGTMDYLFARIMLHLQAESFQRFGLGMSPMSGMAEHRHAPRWQRFGRLLFENGERFYNFRGLRSFKDKFDPVWEARYLATPSGAAPLFALTDIAALIGGGVKGVIAK